MKVGRFRTSVRSSQNSKSKVQSQLSVHSTNKFSFLLKYYCINCIFIVAMSAFCKSELRIQSWNVHGSFFNLGGNRYSKLSNDEEFVRHTSKYLIFGLVETHHTADDVSQLQLVGYKCFQVCRKKLVRGRKSGGICVYVHDSVARGVKRINTTGSESVFIKLSKEYFSFDRDIVVSFCYCVPSGSSYQTRTQFEPFEDFEQKLSNVSNDCDVVCLGDFNARTALKPDYLVSEDNSEIPILDGLFPADSVAAYPRGNLDTGTNTYGDKLLDLCQSVPLRICNGRKLGDVVGSFTCYLNNGQSVVDYCLVSPRIYHLVSSFVVNEFLPDVSDHCSITVTLRTKFLLDKVLADSYEYVEKPKKLSWCPEIANNFERLLQNSPSKAFLAQFDRIEVSTQESLDQEVDSLSTFLVGTAEAAAGPLPTGRRPAMAGRPRARQARLTQRCSRPKWHDSTCEEARRSMRLTSRLLKHQPANPYLKGKLMLECKEYTKLRKRKQKQYVESMFSQLEQIHGSNPKGYMDLVRSLRDGTFDKKVSDTTSHVSPLKWREHFQGLLGPTVAQAPAEEDMIAYIQQNWEGARSELDLPFTRSELIKAISSLKNNKATSFDRVSNEMLKTGKLVIVNQLLSLFNAILSSSLYPSAWRQNILTPLHKSGPLADPGNFRGIAVCSCLGKLFNKLLHNRLEGKCERESLIHRGQGSGRRGSRTSDHLMIIRFLIDKYVNVGGKQLFACFFDLKKAFDTVPRLMLFYTLLKEYNVGGSFLKVFQEMYTNNQAYIKVSEGLCQPFITSVGVLQGEVNSPLLFNLFVNKISEIFDQSCDPVKINKTDQSFLLWADDLVVFSQSAAGLQSAIDKVSTFYASLGLQINKTKTKIIIFNKSGKVLDNYKFLLVGEQLEVADSCQYLGVRLRPSGSLTLAAAELCSKARRAWFSISNVLYQDKRMPVSRAFQLFDSLVTPVALYASEFWFPSVLPKKAFGDKSQLLSVFDSFKAETINQMFCKLLLSVHKKASRLAVLGELGRYPLALRAMAHCLNYRQCLAKKPRTSLIGLAMAEMSTMVATDVDCWLSRVDSMKDLLDLPRIPYSRNSGQKTSRILQKRFDVFWRAQVLATRPGPDGLQHNKLDVYSSFKCHFGLEPYIFMVRNRNQRSHLSRLRLSAHQLGCETGRYRRPPVPREERYCAYCPAGPGGQRPLDTEVHCLTQCVVGEEERQELHNSICATNSSFSSMCNVSRFKTLVCPINAVVCKLVSRYLQLQFSLRDSIDTGECTNPG